jgi:hypothetical protein
VYGLFQVSRDPSKVATERKALLVGSTSSTVRYVLGRVGYLHRIDSESLLHATAVHVQYYSASTAAAAAAAAANIQQQQQQ